MILLMSDWWDAMSLLEKIYWCIAVPFSILFVVQIVLTFFGGDVDQLEASGDADVSVESDTGIDFQFITLKNLIAFFTVFGWSGLACLDGGMSMGKTVIISTVAGIIMMIIMSSIIYFMGKLADSGNLNMQHAVGKVGSVYLTIPPSRSGMGQVQINIQGLKTLDAMTDMQEEIKTGAVIEVCQILNNEILIVKLNS